MNIIRCCLEERDSFGGCEPVETVKNDLALAPHWGL